MVQPARRSSKAEVHRDFESKVPEFRKERQDRQDPDRVDVKTSFSELWAGLAVRPETGPDVAIGLSLEDGVYNVDFRVDKLSFSESLSIEERRLSIEELILRNLQMYQKEHLCKILGVGVTFELDRAAPHLCSRLWGELDVVPMIFEGATVIGTAEESTDVDELADSVARKCLMMFGPQKQPRLTVGYHNEVQLDAQGRAKLTTPEDYEKSTRPPTWRAVNKYITNIKERHLRFAFFSGTPQGGGVALMRHALLRFLRQFGLRVQWYVPKPRPDVFRITKTNHNILQGVAPPEVRVTREQLEKVSSWIKANAEKYWLGDHGPLKAPSEGGADVIICDDPQMPDLIRIAKKEAPDRPVIFRCHIEIRDDLVQQDGSPSQFVWKWLWENIRMADAFISHPVKTFVPNDVNDEKLGWLPATTDWLDGLNKNMTTWELQYYMHILKQQCVAQGLACLEFPARPYITQIARFDPSKGISDVVRSYTKFIDRIKDQPVEKQPQLILCGHGSVDDPDGAPVYDQTIRLIENEFSHLKQDIVVIRLDPSDQLLNAILSLAKVALQLSLREGFEVKVSEALHKGKPVIATQTGGIPLQIQHGKSGFLVERGDTDTVAQHLYNLFTDQGLYDRMSKYAASHVSDEVHTVGNALSWLYLVSKLTGEGGSKEGFKLNRRWINDLARDEVNEPYEEGEPRLPRNLST